MDELVKEINAEKELINQTIVELKNVLPVEGKTKLELAGIAVFLHNLYSGIENIIKRILVFKKISIPTSEFSHRDLINLAVEHKIISLELSGKIDTYRSFRHFLVHGYGIMINEVKIKPLAENLSTVYTLFEKEIEIYLKKL